MGRYSLLFFLFLGMQVAAQPTAAPERLIANDGEALLDQALDNDRRVVRADLAALGETDIRKAPVSITILSAEQIKASGARNLLEALQLVPGITFGRDVDDVIGIAIHGTWAEEGKCLFLLNGMQLNENDFGTYAIGNRIPLDNVERIEVISGPGSVLYGGYAALGVINII
ncbi:MAG: TonB-dependent receptor plug domain-containing protein, partial [Flavobacteriales bacterium]